MLTEAISALTQTLAPTVTRGNALPASGSVIAASLRDVQDMPRRGTRDILQLYEDNPLIHMVASKIGDLVASTNWRVGVVANGVSSRTASDLRRVGFAQRTRMVRSLLDNEELEEIDRHPILDVLDGRDSLMLGRGLRKVNQVYLDLVGETYNLMMFNGFRPTALEPIVPTNVESLPTVERPYYRIMFGAETKEVPAELIFCVRDVRPLDPYGRGVGKGRVLADEIETDEYTAKYLKGHFRSGARPDWLLMSEGLNQAEALRAEKTLMQKLRDFRRSHLPFLFKAPRGSEIHEFQNSFNSGPIVDLRNRQRDFVLQVFSISPEIFGILTSSNRATVVAAREMVAEQVIIPRCEVWREAYQQRLVPLFDERLVIWYDDPRPSDEERKGRAMRSAPWAFTQDEHRMEASHEPVGDDMGGNLRAVPANLSFTADLASVGNQNVAPTPPTPEPMPGDDEAEPMPDTEEESGHGLVRASKQDPYAAFEQALQRMEGALAEAFREALEKMRDGIDLDQLEAALAAGIKQGVEASIPFVIMSDSLIGEYDVWSLDVLSKFGQVAAQQLEDVVGDVSGLDLLSGTARDWAQEHGAEFVRQVTDETRNGLRQLITEAFEERVSRDKLAKMIKERVGLTEAQTNSLLKLEAQLREAGVSEREIGRQVGAAYRKKVRARAKLIAQHETATAGNQGQEEVFRQARAKNLLPPGTKKDVLLGPQACPICHAVKDAGPVGITENFPGHGQAPPFHIGCDCAYRYLVVEEE